MTNADLLIGQWLISVVRVRSTTVTMFLFLLLCISVTSSDGSQPQADDDFVPLEPLTEPVLKAENAPYYDVEPPLPTNIDPLAYYITIRPFFPVEGLTLRPKEKEFTFDGVTSVKIKALENGKRFTFNSYRLNYTTVNVFDANGDEVPIVNYDVEAKPKTGFIHVNLKESPNPGSIYVVHFKYRGSTNSYLEAGMYHTYYVDKEGKKHWMIATHLEQGFRARSVFPCYDEPKYKRRIHFTIISPKGQVALGNMMERPPIPLSGENKEWSLVRFPPTPPMSTYLFAFAVGPFVSKQGYNEAGTLLRVWGWTGQEGYLDFALKVSQRCLYTMGEYTNIKYPLKKLDHLGLPEFRAGAMENWGLIIYRYLNVAFNPALETTDSKQAAARVMCHETIHQWFGNLVTGETWSELFLHEGFAAFFSNYNQRLALPDQLPFLRTVFVTRTQQQGLNMDAEPYRTHPIYDGEGAKFDSIVYKKGASILKMIRATLGPDTFQLALQNYLKKHEYGTATRQMLFDEFTEAARQNRITDWCGEPFNATKFLEPWFLQSNFPLVMVGDNGPVEPPSLNQSPYTDPKLLGPSKFSYKWPIPLQLKNYMRTDEVQKKWLIADIFACPKKHSETNMLHWYYTNVGANAFVRVSYDDAQMKKLLHAIEMHTEQFSVEDLSAMIADEGAFLKKKMDKNGSEQFSVDNLLSLISLVIPKVPHYSILAISIPHIEWLFRTLAAQQDYPLFLRMMNHFFKDNYDKVGWTQSGNWDKDIYRYLMLPYAVRFNVGKAQKDGYKLWKELLIDCKDTKTGVGACAKIPPDVRLAVYMSAVLFGDDDDRQKLRELAQQQAENEVYFPMEYRAMFQALALSNRTKDIDELIPLIIKTTEKPEVFKQVGSSLLMHFAQNPVAGDLLGAYLKKNPQTIRDPKYFSVYVSAMTQNWWSKADIEKFTALRDSLRLNDEHQRIMEDELKKLKSRLPLREKYYPQIVRFLYNQYVTIGEVPWSVQIETDNMKLEPLEYNTIIHPYFPSHIKYPWHKNMTFEGESNMRFKIQRAQGEVNQITVNAHRMIITADDIVIYDKNGNNHKVIGLEKVYDDGFLIIRIDPPLKVGTEYHMNSSYIGFIFDESNEGVYMNRDILRRSINEGWIFSTDFEAGPGARSLLPCMDEPAYKARWKFAIYHPAEMTALQNTMQNKTKILDGGWALTSFKQSPPMCSYIIAFGIGDLASINRLSATNVPIRFWSWTGMERYADYSVKVAADTVDYMSVTFDSPFPMKKLDFLALPQYTSFGSALENFGLIAGKYTALMLDPDYASSFDYGYVAIVVAHETVHQWFGDLVSPAWWSYLFLNEGFAEYWSNEAVYSSFPNQKKYHTLSKFKTWETAMRADASLQTRPVVSIERPLFSSIPYYKGASMLNMLDHVMTPDAFRHGIKLYLKKFAYGIATADNLWESLQAGYEEKNITQPDGRPFNVKKFMHPWTEQAGFPLLIINSTKEKDTRYVHIKQRPFNDFSDAPSKHGPRWEIPIIYKVPEGVFEKFLSSEKGSELKFTVKPSWAIYNYGDKIFARVLYDDESWSLVADQLTKDPLVFDATTRARLMADNMALERKGLVSKSRLLVQLSTMNKETEFLPMMVYGQLIEDWLVHLRGTPIYPRFKKFLTTVIKPVYQRVNWTKSTDWTDNMFSQLVADLSCHLGITECLQKAKHEFEDFIKRCKNSKSGTGLCNTVFPDMRPVQYCYGLQQDAQFFDNIVRLYEWTAYESLYFDRDDDNLLQALGCAKEVKDLNRVITKTVNGAYPVYLLHYIVNHDETNNVLLNYLRENLKEVYYGVSSFSYFVRTAISHCNTEACKDRVTDIIKLAEERKMPSTLISYLKQVQSHISRNVAWVRKEGSVIEEWLTKNGY